MCVVGWRRRVVYGNFCLYRSWRCTNYISVSRPQSVRSPSEGGAASPRTLAGGAAVSTAASRAQAQEVKKVGSHPKIFETVLVHHGQHQ